LNRFLLSGENTTFPSQSYLNSGVSHNELTIKAAKIGFIDALLAVLNQDDFRKIFLKLYTSNVLTAFGSS